MKVHESILSYTHTAQPLVLCIGVLCDIYVVIYVIMCDITHDNGLKLRFPHSILYNVTGLSHSNLV